MDIFSTAVLARVVSALPMPAPFILNSFFRTIATETAAEIKFDIDSGSRRIAPFVSPIVAGKVVQSKGFVTKTFTPAYVKDKRAFNPDRAFKRAIGERIGGALDPMQRQSIAIATDLQDQIDMLTRRQEVMAVEALRTGKIIVVGDEYPEVEVNFGRHADLTIPLTSGDRWGEAGVSPLEDVQAWSMAIAQHSGATANQLVFDTKAWALFSASTEVQKLLDRFRGKDMLASTVVGEGARYMGSLGDYDCWVYTGFYEHPTTGALTPFLPDYTCIVTSADLEGTRHYGAIKDEKAGFQAMPYFPKSWLEEDPSVRWLLMQSAPLPVPYRINACACATVR